MAHKLLFQR